MTRWCVPTPGIKGSASDQRLIGDEHLSTADFRVAARKSTLARLPLFDRGLACRQASVLAKVEHVFLIIKRDFGFVKTRQGKAAYKSRMMHACISWMILAMTG